MGESLSAKEITRADFSISMRGYDRDEVDSFLQTVADEHRRMSEELGAARRKADKPYQSFGADVGELLQQAKDAAEKLKRRAEEQAEQTLQEAKKAAAATREKAQNDANERRKAADYDAEQRIKEAERRVRQLMQAEAESRKRLRDVRAEMKTIIQQMEQAEVSLDGQGLKERTPEPAPGEGQPHGPSDEGATADATRASPNPQATPAA
jgi:cell division initiation protein